MGTYLPGLNFPVYSGWGLYTPVIPKLYWDEYSAEQRMKQLCMSFDKVEHYLDYIANLMNEWNIEFTTEMEKQFADLWNTVNGEFKDKFDVWFNDNISEYITEHIKNCYFGLTLDGYFIAYIPDNWNELVFDTGYNYGEDTYGRLILRWDVDDSNRQVNQRPENWR